MRQNFKELGVASAPSAPRLTPKSALEIGDHLRYCSRLFRKQNVISY